MFRSSCSFFSLSLRFSSSLAFSSPACNQIVVLSSLFFVSRSSAASLRLSAERWNSYRMLATSSSLLARAAFEERSTLLSSCVSSLTCFCRAVICGSGFFCFCRLRTCCASSKFCRSASLSLRSASSRYSSASSSLCEVSRRIYSSSRSLRSVHSSLLCNAPILAAAPFSCF